MGPMNGNQRNRRPLTAFGSFRYADEQPSGEIQLTVSPGTRALIDRYERIVLGRRRFDVQAVSRTRRRRR